MNRWRDLARRITGLAERRWHAKRWFFSFGADARVIESQKLRDDIVQELTRTSNGYQ